MPLFQWIRPPFTENEPEAAAAFPLVDESVGDLLRRQRAEMGLNLREVATALKIKLSYLAAIEEGHPDELPGAPYAVGFVRSYSQYLGLDSTEVLRRFKLEAAGLDAKPDLTFPMPLGERGVPAVGILIVAAILASCGYGIWYYLSTADRTIPERVAEVPAGLLGPRLRSDPGSKSPPAKPAASSDAGEIAVPTSPAGSEAAVVRPNETSPKTDASAPPLASEPKAAAAPPASSGAPAPSSSPSMDRTAAPLPDVEARPKAEPASAAVSEDAGPTSNTSSLAHPAGSPPPVQNISSAPDVDVDPSSRITLRANATSWIQVRAQDHSVLFTGFLKPGDAYRVPDRPGLSMRAGNAGGLDIVVDGKKAPAVGPIGAVRNVSLDPQSLMGQGSGRD